MKTMTTISVTPDEKETIQKMTNAISDYCTNSDCNTCPLRPVFGNCFADHWETFLQNVQPTCDDE